ncbi:hypothetical protein OFC53_35350, partial [Escherichia coli]|nr:hypothetical protein [Escherichia coli]
KEEKNINELLSKLLEHQHITQDAHDTFVKKYTVFIDKWKEAIRLTLDYPLHADLAEFELSFNNLLDFLIDRTDMGESYRELLYE